MCSRASNMVRFSTMFLILCISLSDNNMVSVPSPTVLLYRMHPSCHFGHSLSLAYLIPVGCML